MSWAWAVVAVWILICGIVGAWGLATARTLEQSIEVSVSVTAAALIPWLLLSAVSRAVRDKK